MTNSVSINALTPPSENAEFTYAMAAVGKDSDGREYLAILHVDRSSNVGKVDFVDAVHFVNERIRKNNGYDAKSSQAKADKPVLEPLFI